MYWDTSALVKIYTPESDSGYFLDLIGSEDKSVFTSVITGIELCCALNRREQAGDIRRADAARAMKRFARDCEDGRITRLSCGDEVVARVMEIVGIAASGGRPLMIRSLDAIHIASALSIRAGRVVTTDNRQREVAKIFNLNLVPVPTSAIPARK
jgi:predicted nucleic acid-binding protein